MKVTRFVILALVWLGCPLDPTVEYRCSEAQPQCPVGAVCRDGVCQLNAGGGTSVAGGGGGGSAGGEAGGDATGGGSSGGTAGGAVDAGVDGGAADGGVDGGACTPEVCDGTECGYKRGCGQPVVCGVCVQGQECGVTAPNRCGPTPSLCTTEGLCWENPRLHGNAVLDVYAPTERIIWLPTSNGMLLFFDGERTSVEPIPTRTGIDFNAIHGCDRNDIYLVGDRGLILHYDGARWTEEVLPVPSRPDLTFVHCVGNGGLVIAGGGNNAIFVRQGGQWLQRNSTLNSNRHHAASIGQQRWLLNQNGRLLVQGTSDWEPDGSVPLNDVRDFKAVAGRLYALGQVDAGLSRLVERFDDGGWGALFDVPPEQPGDTLGAFDSLDGDEFWFAGAFNGVRRATRDGGVEPRRLDPAVEVRTYHAVKAQGPGRAFFAGSEGTYAFARGPTTRTTAIAQRIGTLGKLCSSSGPTPTLLAPQNSNSNLVRDDSSGVAQWPPLDSPDEARATNWRACAFRSADQVAIVGTDAGVALSSRGPQGFATASFATVPDAGGLDFIRVWATPGALRLLTAPSSSGQYIVTWDGGSTTYLRVDGGLRDVASAANETLVVGDQGLYRFNTGESLQLANEVRAIAGGTRQGNPFFVLAGRDGAWWTRLLGNIPMLQTPFTDGGLTGVWVGSSSAWFVGAPPGGVPGAMLYIRADDGRLVSEPFPSSPRRPASSAAKTTPASRCGSAAREAAAFSGGTRGATAGSEHCPTSDTPAVRPRDMRDHARSR